VSAVAARQPSGGPAGGQFAPSTHPEAGLTLEALADTLGVEDPTFDPDDPYGGDLLDALDAAEIAADEALARYDLPGAAETDADALAALAAVPGDVLEHVMAVMAVMDEAWTFAGTHRQAVDGSMSIDDMTPTQRGQFDSVYAHAYDFAHAAIGGKGMEDSDDAERFAGFVGQALIRNGFDDTTFELNRLMDEFDRARTADPTGLFTHRSGGRPPQSAAA